MKYLLLTLLFLLPSFAFAAPVVEGATDTTTGAAVCLPMPVGKITVQCTTESFYMIKASNDTTALTAKTAMIAVEKQFYDEMTNHKLRYLCVQAVATVGSCTGFSAK